MEGSEYIKIFTGNFIVVQLIRDRLEAIGINPIIKDESESARMAGFGTFSQGLQELYVNNDELDRSVAIVESVRSEMEANAGE
ncbi:putative signal transducing protein [Lacinutrix salivirga]